jgi:hypothetical protein
VGHLNGAETSALALVEAPSILAVLKAAGVPKNSAERKRNARVFDQALADVISGKYGGKNINSIYSHPDLPPGVLEKKNGVHQSSDAVCNARHQ